MSRLPTEKRTEPGAPRLCRGALFVGGADFIARRVSLLRTDVCRVSGLPNVLETACPGGGLMCAVYPGCRSHCVPRTLPDPPNPLCAAYPPASPASGVVRPPRTAGLMECRAPDTARYLIGSRARHICPMQVPAGFSQRAFLSGLFPAAVDIPAAEWYNHFKQNEGNSGLCECPRVPGNGSGTR